MTRLIPVLILAALAGCADHEAEHRAALEHRAFLAAQDEATCKSYGLSAGTEAYAGCRIQLETQRRNAAVQYDAMTRGVVLQHLLAR